MNEAKTFQNSLTLVRVLDGETRETNSYFIQTNYDDILRFDNAGEISFSPAELNFRVYNVSDMNTPLSLEKNWSLSILDIDTNEFVSMADYSNYSKYEEYIDFQSKITADTGADVSVIEEEEAEDYTLLYFYVGGFYKFLGNKQNMSDSERRIQYLLSQSNFTLKFTYVIDGKSVACKIISAKFGVSEDMAQLHIGAENISAFVRDCALQLDANGLALANGDFTIVDVKYKQVEITSDQFESNKYYILGNNSDYILATEYSDEDVYYTYEEEKVFYTTDGNLTLKGDIYANNGEFHGNIYANNGSFNGQVTATGGSIGGFNIVSSYYSQVQSPEDEKEGYYITLDSNNPVYYKIIKNGANYYIQLAYAPGDHSEIDSYYSYDGTDYIKVDVCHEGEIYYAKLIIPAISTYYEDLGGRLYSGDNIILDGGSGQIYAKNITLGEGAKISDSIVLSKEGGQITAAIYNPSEHEGKVLEAANILLTNKGKLNLGTIELYGGTGEYDGYMRSLVVDSNNQQTTGNWIIRENGTAEFNNIIANNAKFQQAVFEIGTVQSIGSLMLFKDSWKISGVEQNTSDGTTLITLEAPLSTTLNLKPNDWVADNTSFYQVVEVINNTFKVNGVHPNLQVGNIITKFGKGGTMDYIPAKEERKKVGRVYYEFDSEQGEYVLTQDLEFVEGKKYYYIGEQGDGDYILSILGEEEIGNRKYATGNSLTISSFYLPSASLTPPVYTKHLILGDLSNSNIDDLDSISGFGLYSDNVYLNGSLTTRIKEGSYAGINTINGFKTNKFTHDFSEIVFWAGAPGMEEADVQDATFQVTKNGSVYANQGYFKGSIITDSIIEGSDIYAARIHGGKSGETAPLSIYDAGENSGIGFYKNYDPKTNGIELFQIQGSGFKKGGSYFIQLPETGSAVFQGEFKTQSEDVQIIDNKINFVNSDFSILSKLDIDNSGQPQLIFSHSTENQIIVEPKKFEVLGSTWLNLDLFLGRSLHYQAAKINEVEVGYDLYIQ